MNASPSIASLACVLGVVVAGCTVRAESTSTAQQKPPVMSASLPTSEMWPSFSAQSYGDGIRVYAALLHGGDFVTLSDGEFFTADVGADTGVVLLKEPNPDTGKVHYIATFAARDAETPVTISFHRGAGVAGAPLSKTFIPASFEITSAPPTSFKTGDALRVTVAPPPVLQKTTTDRPRDLMAAMITGDCLLGDFWALASFDAQGAASIDTRSLALKSGATGCDVVVQVRHETAGLADPALKKNADAPYQVEGLQARSFRTAVTR